MVVCAFGDLLFTDLLRRLWVVFEFRFWVVVVGWVWVLWCNLWLLLISGFAIGSCFIAVWYCVVPRLCV